MIQIREDFMNHKVIDRILQMEGFKNYPEQFEILVEIQHAIGDEEV